jgi:hypothetical protein
MKILSAVFVLLFATTTFAADTYECVAQSDEGTMTALIVKDGSTAQVTVDGDVDTCEAADDQTTLSEVDSAFAQQGVPIQTQLVIACTAASEMDSIGLIITSGPVADTGGNTVITNPVFGPIGVANCTKK